MGSLCEWAAGGSAVCVCVCVCGGWWVRCMNGQVVDSSCVCEWAGGGFAVCVYVLFYSTCVLAVCMYVCMYVCPFCGITTVCMCGCCVRSVCIHMTIRLTVYIVCVCVCVCVRYTCCRDVCALAV